MPSHRIDLFLGYQVDLPDIFADPLMSLDANLRRFRFYKKNEALMRLIHLQPMAKINGKRQAPT